MLQVIILHSESIVVGTVGLVTYLLISKTGGSIAEMLDERAKGILDALNVGKNARVANLEAQIASAVRYFTHWHPALGPADAAR